MFRLFIILIVLKSILATQEVDIDEQLICDNTEKCLKVDKIFIPTQVQKCTKELFFEFSKGLFAYLSPEGKISSESSQTDCELGFRDASFVLSNKLIEVVKHKMFIYLKKVTDISINDKTTTEATSLLEMPSDNDFISFIKKKIHDFVQYVIIALIILVRAVFFFIQKCIQNQSVEAQNVPSTPHPSTTPEASPSAHTVAIPSAPPSHNTRPESDPWYRPVLQQTGPYHQPCSQASFSGDLLKAALDVGKSNYSSFSVCNEVQIQSGYKVAQGRSDEEKLKFDVQCPHCFKWFTKGASINAHTNPVNNYCVVLKRKNQKN
jgi:hypothetical protein